MLDMSRLGLTTAMHPTSRLQGGGDKCATGVKIAIKLPKEGTMGTWNVHSLHASEKVQELTHELKCCHWDILGLADVRWMQFEETPTDKGHKIWYCREDLEHRYGVTFIVRKEVVGSIISCTPISSRLISIQISGRPGNFTVIQVCAPTSDHEDEAVKQFYEQLDGITAKTPKKNILVVQGNWNAKVGPDTYQHLA